MPDPRVKVETKLEKELAEMLLKMVLHNCCEEKPGEYYSSCIRLHKEVMIKLCDLGLMVEVYPHQREEGWYHFNATVNPDWRKILGFKGEPVVAV